jgi:cysteine sulfinate desulfinase/cysteine desulfurase-like protein
MKVTPDWLQGAVRFSLGRFNTEKEIDYVNEKMPAIVQRLEGLSSLGKLASRRTEERSAGATVRARG